MNMKETIEILMGICAKRRSGYGQDLPSALDRKFIEVARAYIEAAPEARARLRSVASEDCGRFLLGFSSRLAIMAARAEDVELVQLALVAHLLEDLNDDERDASIRLILIHHVATRLGLEADEMFRQVGKLGSGRLRDYLSIFAARSTSEKALSSTGWVETVTSEGVDYHYRSHPRPIPEIPTH